jgi:predicted exporter
MGRFFLPLKKIFSPPVFRYALLASLAALGAGILFFNPSGVKIENDIRSLYTISAPLLESEMKAAQVLDYGSSPWYFVVSGGSPEETLENEEALAARLEREVSRGNAGSFLGVSASVPSVKSRNRPTKQ